MSEGHAQHYTGDYGPHFQAFGNPYSGDFSKQASLDADTGLRHKPVFGLELGVISLARETPASQALALDPGFNTILDANQLQGNMGAGLDATMNFYNLFSNCKAIDVQMRYFQAGDMEATTRVTSGSTTTLFFNAVPATPVSSNDFIYETRVRSFESNLVARTPYRIRFLMGYRFLEVDERFDINDNINSSPGATIGVFSRAENTMGGFQVGSEATLLTNGHSRIFGSFKYGILNNDILGTGLATNGTGSPIQTNTFDSVTSTLLDFQLGGSLSLSRTWSLYAGYQGLVLSDLALALEQSRNGGIVSTPTNPVYFQDAQFHGFKITGMATW